MTALATIDHSLLFAKEGLEGHQILRTIRTVRAENYQRLFEASKRRIRADRTFRDDMHELQMQLRGVAPKSVHQNTFMDNFSVQYANDDFVGDRLMPPVPVTKRSNSYVIYTKRDRFGFPNDEM